jgi:hypothetical protein
MWKDIQKYLQFAKQNNQISGEKGHHLKAILIGVVRQDVKTSAGRSEF